MSTLIAPLATMEAAWQERERLQAVGDRLFDEGRRLFDESDRLRAKGDLVVIMTAQALHGKDVQIDWANHTAKPYEENA